MFLEAHEFDSPLKAECFLNAREQRDRALWYWTWCAAAGFRSAARRFEARAILSHIGQILYVRYNEPPEEWPSSSQRR